MRICATTRAFCVKNARTCATRSSSVAFGNDMIARSAGWGVVAFGTMTESDERLVFVEKLPDQLVTDEQVRKTLFARPKREMTKQERKGRKENLRRMLTPDGAKWLLKLFKPSAS